jgi:hypothetical protein
VKNERSSSNDSSDGFYQEHVSWIQRCLLGEFGSPYLSSHAPHFPDRDIQLPFGSTPKMILKCIYSPFTSFTVRLGRFCLHEKKKRSNKVICIFKASIKV